MSTSIKQNQDGMVAITVTVIIISLVTLITIGFATLVRRDQRQAIDRQLSAQAFYAAETGINDAVERLKTNTSEINDCNDTAANFNNVLSATDKVEYSCLLIDTTPDKLTFDPITTSKSVVVPVRNENGSAVTSVELSWQRTDGSSRFESNNYHNLLRAGSDDSSDWGDRTSILRIDLIPADDISQSSLTNNTRTFFLYPKQSNNPGIGVEQYQLNEANQKLIVDANCNTANTPEHCKARINLSGVSSSSYYLRLSSIYADARVTVKAFSNGAQAQLTGAQAVIDVTGKAVDVLRRLQVTIPLVNQFDFPEYAVETTDTLCKRLEVWPGGPSGPGGVDYQELPSNFDPSVDTERNKNICNPIQP